MTANSQPHFNVQPPYEETNEQAPPAYDGSMTKGTSLEKKTLASPKDKEIDIDIHSVNSATSSVVDVSDTLLPNVPFNAGPSFHVSARGIGVFRFPLPYSELEIDISKPDGTIAYTSTRARKSKGDCVLTAPDKGDLISTSYFFGPNKHPVLKRMDQGGPIDSNTTVEQGDSLFDMKTKWTSRAVTLVHRPTNRVFEWSYDRIRTTSNSKAVLLVLRWKDSSAAAEIKNTNTDESDGKGKVLAQLIRSNETRTPGSKSCSAGNGGQLVIDRDAETVLEEELVVATCLMMLKREIDRRRSSQWAMLMSAGAAGSG